MRAINLGTPAWFRALPGALAAILILLAGAQARAQTSTIVLPGNVEWLDSGIDVQANVAFTLAIDATGSWRNTADSPPVGPEGFKPLTLPNAIAPAEPFASLIGRVGAVTFGIGDSFRGRSPASGRLFLSMNDVPGTFADNTGELSVVIGQTVNPRLTRWEDPVAFLDLQTPDPQPFFERPLFIWRVRNKLLPSFNAELVVLLDGVPAATDPALPVLLDIGPNSERAGSIALVTGAQPFLAPGDHTVTFQVWSLTPSRKLVASRSAYVTSFVPAPPPSLAIVGFKAEPDHQNQGKEIKLSWTLKPTGYCIPADLLLKKKDYGEPEVLILQIPTPPSTGERTEIVKATSSPLTYELSAACKVKATAPALPGTGVAAEVKVTFGADPPPPAPNVVGNGPFFTPIQPHHKLPLAVSWTFQNLGGAKSAEFDVQLYLDGAKEGDAQTVPEFEPGKSKNLTWTITKELLAGTHSVELKRVDNDSSLGHHPFPVLP